MSCSYCNGTGLIPFERNGKVVPGAFLHCSCHPIYGDDPEPERYQPVEVADFDFPASDVFRGFAYEYCGQPDPGYIPPEPAAPPPKVVEHRYTPRPRQSKMTGYKGIR